MVCERWVGGAPPRWRLSQLGGRAGRMAMERRRLGGTARPTRGSRCGRRNRAGRRARSARRDVRRASRRKVCHSFPPLDCSMTWYLPARLRGCITTRRSGKSAASPRGATRFGLVDRTSRWRRTRTAKVRELRPLSEFSCCPPYAFAGSALEPFAV